MIPLTQLPRRLAPAAARVGKLTPSYLQCYRAVLDARIPAEKNGRVWEINEVHVPLAECVLGLTSDPVTAAAA